MNTTKTKTLMPLLLASGLLMSGVALANHHEGGAGKDDMHHHEGMRGGMGMGPGPMFAKFDTDKDGRISKEEMRAGTDKMFAEVDTNKDGFISKEEADAHHKAMRDKMREKMRERPSK